MNEAKATTELPGKPAPTLFNTRHGPIEYVASGEGPAVLALHGAMGGYDQGQILVRTIPSSRTGTKSGHGSRSSSVIWPPKPAGKITILLTLEDNRRELP